jgi:hypothetical protein
MRERPDLGVSDRSVGLVSKLGGDSAEQGDSSDDRRPEQALRRRDLPAAPGQWAAEGLAGQGLTHHRVSWP